MTDDMSGMNGMSGMDARFDLAIVGAGPGGYSAALRAAERGLHVALVERDATLGGTCLNRGCIPSKALIGATHTIDTIRRAGQVGIQASVEGIDFAALRDHRLRVVETMTQGLAGLLAHRGVTVFRAEAALMPADANETDDQAKTDVISTVRLTASTGQTEVLRFDKADMPKPQGASLDLKARHVALAMGSRPRPLPGIPFHGALIDSTQALALDTFPASAIVIGAGAVAVEFASMWNAAGVKVTLVIRRDRVLSGWDRRAGATLTRELKRQGVEIISGAAVTAVDTGDNLGARVHVALADGTERAVEGEIALAAIGRDPITDQDWLPAAGIMPDEHGLIPVDPLGRTARAGVWALGDITAGHALAHRAFAQGIALAEAIAGLNPSPVNEECVPSVVFSNPEAASVGLTGAQAKERTDLANVSETAYPMLSNARMLMSGQNGSMTIVSGEREDRPGVPVVLGVHIVAPVASDLIAEAQQLVGNRVPLSDAARLVHPHPTFAETLGEALLKADGRPLNTR